MSSPGLCLTRRRFLLTSAAAAAAVTAGCAGSQGTQTRVTEIWRTEDRAASVGRLLIVVVAPDAERRLNAETGIAETFSSAGTPAFSTESLLGQQYPYPRPALITLTEQNELDGVLVVRLISDDQAASVDVTGPVVGDDPRAKWSEHLRHAYEKEGVAPYQTVRAETLLYQVAGEKLIWSGLSETFAPENANDALRSYSQSMVRGLADDGFLRR